MDTNRYETEGLLGEANTEETPIVDVVASGYEWECPMCEHLNKEIEFKAYYTCADCGLEVQTDIPEHCYG